MSNLITDRVAYFLKDYPPFDSLNDNERNQIAHQITVKYFEKDELIFKEGQTNNDFCYVLNQGNIKLTKTDASGDTFLVDQCEPGDVFGVRSIITGNPYSMSAVCIEESLVYAIPKAYFGQLFQHNAPFSTYFASGYAAGQVIVRADQNHSTSLRNATLTQTLDYSKTVITCSIDTTIRKAAETMKDHSVGSIIITDDQDLPLGIVTDTDLRNKVLAAGVDSSAMIESIMSTPVNTVAPSVSISEVLMEMIGSGVHHLVVTTDGSSRSKVCGIISDHDVVLSQQNHPASLIKSIKRSDDPAVWKDIRDKAEKLLQKYLEQEISISLISKLLTKINDTIIEKAIQLALEQYPEAKDIEFCWLNLGSEGREEQLLRTDQDNAIVFADSPHHNDASQKVLLKVANYVNEALITCGFVKCPADIMARNPKYCQPLSEWKAYFSSWVEVSDPKAVMNATIFFDYRLGYGSPALIKQLNEHLIEQVKTHEMFFNFLAQNALQNPPPLSFFNNFLVEKSGEHKDEFDIKKRGMMPLSDIARLLLLAHHITGIQNTAARFRKLAEIEPKNKEMFEAAAASYQLFVRHRTMNGLNNQDSGRFIALNHINKLDKQQLKNAFLSIQELQDMIRVRFQQAYFS